MAEVQSYLGQLHLASENPKLALACFEQVQNLTQRRASGQVIEALSYQALAHLALGQFELALSCSNQALTRLSERQNNLIAAQRVYLNHYKILQATQQPAQAQVVLAQAREIMHQQAAEINLTEQTGASLARVKELFFSNLPWNRELLSS
jgi:tetratricopeptide (TPR) repeat protein